MYTTIHMIDNEYKYMFIRKNRNCLAAPRYSREVQQFTLASVDLPTRMAISD